MFVGEYGVIIKIVSLGSYPKGHCEPTDLGESFAKEKCITYRLLTAEFQSRIQRRSWKEKKKQQQINKSK